MSYIDLLLVLLWCSSPLWTSTDKITMTCYMTKRFQIAFIGAPLKEEKKNTGLTLGLVND